MSNLIAFYKDSHVIFSYYAGSIPPFAIGDVVWLHRLNALSTNDSMPLCDFEIAGVAHYVSEIINVRGETSTLYKMEIEIKEIK